jgi:hypothetical protein
VLELGAEFQRTHLVLPVRLSPLKAPFRITGHTWEYLDVLFVTLEGKGHEGRGEAAGVYYKNDTPASAVRPKIEAALTRATLEMKRMVL